MKTANLQQLYPTVVRPREEQKGVEGKRQHNGVSAKPQQLLEECERAYTPYASCVKHVYLLSSCPPLLYLHLSSYTPYVPLSNCCRTCRTCRTGTIEAFVPLSYLYPSSYTPYASCIKHVVRIVVTIPWSL
jgi:hypothetical protein